MDWSACGPVANEVALAALTGRKPDVGLCQAIVARDTAAHRFAQPGGQRLSDIAWDLGKRGVQKLDVTLVPENGSPDLNALHTQVREAALAGLPVIIEVSRAYNLPDNEGGVDYHFVCIGGIDSILGYLVANGDTLTFIRTRQTWMTADQMRWATWATLEAAGICGAITVHPNDTPPPPPPPPAPPPPPPPPDYQAEIVALQQQVATLTAGVASATTASQTASQAAAAAQNGVAAMRAVLHSA